jgi:flagella basal body P-ring formation protein FlgA
MITRLPQSIRITIALAMAIVPMLSLAATGDSNPYGDATPLAKDAVTAAFTTELSAHFNLEGELHVDLLHAWAPPEHVAHNWKIELSDYPMLPSASMLLHCRIVADGAVVSESLVTVHAELWRDVWVVRQPLNTGSTFDRTMLESRRVDAFRERDVVPSSVGDASFVFLRGVQTGHFLTWHDIGRRPLVRKGDLVDVTASEGALSISMKALAMQNGAQGEAVTVRNLDSRKDFTAIVVDENHVQIRF